MTVNPDSNRRADLMRKSSPERMARTIRAGLEAQPGRVEKWAESFVAYLTLTNGGAATAVLALLGANEAFRGVPATYLALALFIAGLALVGSAWIAQGFRIEQETESLLKIAQELVDGNDDIARDNFAALGRSSTISKLRFTVARASFYLFVGGCLCMGVAAFGVL